MQRTRSLLFPLALSLVCGFAAHAPAQETAAGKGPSPADLAFQPLQWAEAASGTEQHIVNYDRNAPLRYTVRKVDAKGESVRVVIESKDGPVGRTIEHNGQPLSEDDEKAERARLQDILDSPDTFRRHVRRDEGSLTYATELLRSMPQAMLWSYVPGQPQLANAPGPAVVLDFKPNPSWKPPTLVTEALTGISGRVWVDTATHCVTRIQGTILHQVNFGWGGVLARIREGGHVEFEQRQASKERWLYSHISEHLSIREVLVHTTEENTEVTVSDAQAMPSTVSVQDAIHTLLALPVARH